MRFTVISVAADGHHLHATNLLSKGDALMHIRVRRQCCRYISFILIGTDSKGATEVTYLDAQGKPKVALTPTSARNGAARELAHRFEIPLRADFHALPRGTVTRILAAADSVKYKAPRNASGSRARCFYQKLCRDAGRI